MITELSFDTINDLTTRAAEQIPHNLLALVSSIPAGVRRRTLTDILASDLVSEISNCFTRDHIRTVIDFLETRGDITVADGGLVRRTATYLVTDTRSTFRGKSAILVGSGVSHSNLVTFFANKGEVVTRVIFREAVPIGLSKVVANLSTNELLNLCITVDAQECLNTVPMLYKSFPPIVQVKTRLPEEFIEKFVPGNQFEPVPHNSLFTINDWSLIRGSDSGLNRERRYVLVTPYGNHVDVPRTQVRLIKWWLNWLNGRPIRLEASNSCVIVPADVPNEIHRYLTWMMEIHQETAIGISAPTGYMQSYDVGTTAIAHHCVATINKLNTVD